MAKTIRVNDFSTNGNEALIIPGYEPYKIPKNWCWTRIDSVCRIFTGDSINERVKAEKYTGRSDGYVYIATKDIGFDSAIDYETNVRIPKEEKFKIAPQNTTLLCIEGGSAGRKIGFVTQDVCFVNKLCAFVPNKRIFPKYLYYAIQSEAFKNQFDEKKHGLIGGVSLKEISSIYIPLIPFNQQNAIVAKIESLFSKLDKAKENPQKVLNSFEVRKASILSNAFSGKLTEKWRKEHKIKQYSWKKKTLEDVCKSIYDGDHMPPPKSEAGIPFLVISNVNTGYLSFEDTRFVPQDYYDSLTDTRKPEKGDVLYTLVGSYGIPVVVNTDAPFCFQRHMALLKPKSINTFFLWYLLQTQEMYQKASILAKGVAQLTVPIKGLRLMEFNCPTEEEQVEIVNVLNELFDKENLAKYNAEHIIEQIELMKKSILARAFRGELGTNNPNDENAEELLKRILSEKAKEANEQPKVKRTRIVIPEEVENLLQTNLEREIIKLFYKSETKKVPEEDVMSVSSKSFDNLDAVQSLENKKLIKKNKNGTYKLLR